MAIVVRLGPLPLQHRRAARITELERIFGTVIDLIEVFTVAELVAAVGTSNVIAVALDAPPPGQLSEAVAARLSLACIHIWDVEPAGRNERPARWHTAPLAKYPCDLSIYGIWHVWSESAK